VLDNSPVYRKLRLNLNFLSNFNKKEFIMLAFQFNSFDPDVTVALKKDAPKPSPNPNQVLVEVYAAALNPVDKAIMAGYMKEMVHLPATLGGDFSGVVVEVGASVSEYKKGDKVFGQAIVLNGGSGTLAQFTASNAGNTALKPKNINFADASSLPLAGASALQAIEEHIKLKAGQKILIHGGAGGIGSLAIQIAKSLGAFIATTVSFKDKEYAKSLGADKVIDFQSENFEFILEDYDAVLDTSHGDSTNRSFPVLKKGGVLVSLLSAPDPELAKKHGVTAMRQLTNTDAPKLKRLADLVDSGKLKPQVDKVFPMDQIHDAFTHMSENHPRGKVVIKIKD
jgi:NADPH:quinone reductase-like Zn-dependent oxidoreductase